MTNKNLFSFSWMAAIGFFIAVFVFIQANRIEDDEVRSSFLTLSNLTTRIIEKDIANIQREMEHVALLGEAFPQATKEDFARYKNDFLKQIPYLTALIWDPYPIDEISSKEIKGNLNISIAIPNRGVVTSLINIKKLISSNITKENADAMNVYGYKGKELIASYDGEQGRAPQEPDLSGAFINEASIDIGDNQLKLLYIATPAFIVHSWQPTLAAAAIIFITCFISVIAFILRRRSQEMEKTVDQLEAAQNRLIVQENLASLGGLTAGVAHEIKNPLNFINNFSTLSIDLVDELDSFFKKYKELGSQQEREEISLSMENLKGNISTIHSQGEKADNTIQRMLAHARSSPAEWGHTDINKLLDEYASLTFHGMRAKNPQLHVKIEKSFDPNIKEIEAVTNDLGRVFMNLLNNAFQAVEEKSKLLGDGYSNPSIQIRTETLGDTVRIHIRDNGTGISEQHKPKIFTPFFTTKPTGSGTGLGLSLSYNVIVCEHHGSLTFNSKENEFTEFTITIPVKRIVQREVQHA